MTWAHLEITTGILSKPARIYCGNVAGLDFEDIGKRIYFVEAVEPDGGRIVLHDGFSYTAAIGAADGVARSEGIPVHDLAGGAA